MTSKRLRVGLWATAKRSVIYRGRYLALVGAGIIAAGSLAFATAGPAAAQSGGEFVYLASASQYHLYVPRLATKQEVGVETSNSYYDEWNVLPEGYWSAAGVSGQSYEFQVSGSSLCVADTDPSGTTGQGGGSGMNHPDLLACGANGTVWVASANGDGYYLYDRYLLDLYGYPDVMGDYVPGSSNLFALIDTNDLNSGWFVRWQF
jgi:hypothetical protein